MNAFLCQLALGLGLGFGLAIGLIGGQAVMGALR